MTVAVEDIADAIVAALTDEGNAAEFPEAFTANWDYVIDKPYTAYTTDPEVAIIPAAETNDDENRAEDRFDFELGIVVIRKVENSAKATVQPLLNLPRAIRDFLKKQSMAGCERGNVSIVTLFGTEELREDATLVSVISAKYWIDQ
ncbi:hypothetical protein [Paremcibacter congregatus]|uniref:hypothetical protein n=1 Tax=Paremcibacter congregatus TaxID=2043170 RepID=UPI003A93DD18